jgi:spore coat polysaccharide biosynthesis protein SpsF
MTSQPSIRIVLQARLSSRRLPAKVLLPVRGHSLAALCYRRATNTGVPAVAATSEDSTDDALVDHFNEQAIPCLRGPLDDVLARILAACRGLDDTTVIVRLTCDNPLPDGGFVRELVRSLTEEGLGYLGTGSPADGLPYGLSAEAFRLGLLREAAREATDPADREHVTPWIIRRHRRRLFRPAELAEDLSHLRCTVDTQEDYLRVLRLFRDVDDPVRAPWRELCRRLPLLDGEPAFRVPFLLRDGHACSRMTLGTAQLGARYGIANRTGMPDQQTARTIVREAVRHGVTGIDTARAYGEAERRIGLALAGGLDRQVRVTSKLEPLDWLTGAESDPQIRAAVDASLFRSCTELGLERLDALLLHRWSHRRAAEGRIWRRLRELQAEGRIGRLGASVQSPAEAVEAIRDPEVTHLQLPYNLLDWRWERSEFPALAAARPEVAIEARSVFLQGLLLLDAERWPAVPGHRAAETVRALDACLGETGRRSRAELCVAYVLGSPWIGSAVVGVETPGQLAETLALFRNPPLSAAEAARLRERLPQVPEQVLDPARWPRMEG